jgi:hypothetical protein
MESYMPAAKSDKNVANKKASKALAVAKLDVVFSGPLLFVPEIANGNIAGVEVYSPCNGHPVGAVFLPGVFFTDAELDAPETENWPDSRSLSLLDPHSHSVHLTQSEKHTRFPAASIPDTNHKVKSGRRLSADWEVSIAIHGQLSGWTSHRLYPVTAGMYYGSDAPASATVTTLQRLSYASVGGGELRGVSPEQSEYFSANLAQGGTLIVEGETPYQSSLLHERHAIDALAKLAGLNLHLTINAPIAGRMRLQGKDDPCYNSIIVV